MKTFLKANAASLIASICDYLVTVVLVQLLHLDAVLASITGTVTGGVVNFFINRHWVFETTGIPAIHQGKKYFIAWCGNLILNALGVYLLIRFAGVYYMIAKVTTSVFVAVAYNYPIQKNYVFKNIKK